MDEYRVETGIAGLDDIVKGGFPNGHLFVVEGDPGTGKTTLGLQYLLAGVERNEKAMYVTLSESREELVGVAKSHGWSLDRVELLEFSPSEESLRSEDQYSVFHPSEVEFQDIAQAVLREVERGSPARLVVDSLSELQLLAQDSLRYRRQVLAFKRFFSNRGCTVLLLDDKTADRGDGQLHSIAHGVISLERLPREYGIERRRLRIAKLRGSTFREGYHDYKIETGGVRVFPRLVAGEHRDLAVTGDGASGIAALDALWGGGLPRGSSTLFIGPAGSGKSSLAMQYAIQAARENQFAAAFLFDETRQTAIKRLTGLSLDPMPLLESGHLHIEQLDPAELSPGEFIERVRYFATEKKARAVLIDSLNGFINAMPGDRYLAIQMHELLTYLNQRGLITILVMAQTGILGTSMNSPVDLSYLADNILLTRYFEAAGSVRKAISVVKKRSGEHEHTIRELRFRQGRIEIGEPLREFQGILSGVPEFIGSQQALLGKAHE